MRTIWAYDIPYNRVDNLLLDLPRTAKAISVAGVVEDTVSVWFEIPDSTLPLERRKFVILPTGSSIPNSYAYIGTVHESTRAIHLYESFSLTPEELYTQ